MVVSCERRWKIIIYYARSMVLRFVYFTSGRKGYAPASFASRIMERDPVSRQAVEEGAMGGA